MAPAPAPPAPASQQTAHNTSHTHDRRARCSLAAQSERDHFIMASSPERQSLGMRADFWRADKRGELMQGKTLPKFYTNVLVPEASKMHQFVSQLNTALNATPPIAKSPKTKRWNPCKTMEAPPSAAEPPVSESRSTAAVPLPECATCALAPHPSVPLTCR